MTTRITVSLPDVLVEQARRAVTEKKASSVSDYVAQAMQEKWEREPLGDLLEEMDKEFGPVSKEARDWARAELARADAEIAAKIAARRQAAG